MSLTASTSVHSCTHLDGAGDSTTTCGYNYLMAITWFRLSVLCPSFL